MSTTQIQEAVFEERTRCVKIVEQIRDMRASHRWICDEIIKAILGTASLLDSEAKTP